LKDNLGYQKNLGPKRHPKTWEKDKSNDEKKFGNVKQGSFDNTK
jgi:hypothetical protein